MKELRLIVEITGFDRLLYKETAHWDKCTLSMNDASSAHVEIWESDIDTADKIEPALIRVKGKLRRLILSIEWAYGCELSTKILNIQTPTLDKIADVLEILDSMGIKDRTITHIQPKGCTKGYA